MAGSAKIIAIAAPRPVAGLLAFAAGTVDACTVLALFGLYVAQVTGSFVLVGLQIVNADVINVIRTLAIPVFFLAGFATVFLAEMAGNAGRALVWTLLAELALVAGLVAVGIAASPFDHPNAPWALLASVLGVSAMGVQSALVRLLLHDTVSTNVMTTNTTLAAIELAQWTIASRRLAKNPTDAAALEALRHARRRFSGLWPVLAGFLAGACCGAIGFERFGFRLALLPLAVLAGILVWALRRKTPN